MTHRLMIAAILTLRNTTMTAHSTSPDPCSLLTVAQVSAALGVAVEAGKPIGSRACYWHETGGTSSKKVSLTLLTPQAFATGRSPLPGTEKPAVPGVGDDAYYKYFTAPEYDRIKAVDLDVKKGDSFFGVDVSGLALDEAKAKAKSLALAILTKL